ncbi:MULTISPECIES: hypothetical protein [Halorussus]|uniref:hypothetical protein n=1 Tax=Halorussus TaxID=1070314 RepID=UPI00209F22D0|nr:hypothetical protein [Halorussus vallis]USZ74826.1 hypothetical protein NGM07_15455 [Halorussus vallis]
MDWSRLPSAVIAALFVGFLLGTHLSPPDAFTQLFYSAPLVVVALPFAYRFEPELSRATVGQHAIFVVCLIGALARGNRLVPVPDGAALAFARAAFALAGLALGGWLAYLGGLGRLRDGAGA